jgi:hypothetical protein
MVRQAQGVFGLGAQGFRIAIPAGIERQTFAIMASMYAKEIF